MCVLIEIDWIRTNEYFIIFPSLHTSQSGFGQIFLTPLLRLFLLSLLVVASVHQFTLLVIFFTKNALFVSHTHTHINQSINQKCRDQRTIRSPSSPLFRSKRDLKFPRTSPGAFYFTSAQSSSISLLSKKTREIALLGIAVSPSLPLDSSAFQLWSRATA